MEDVPQAAGVDSDLDVDLDGWSATCGERYMVAWGARMSDLEKAARICDELEAVFRDAAASGRAHERIDELVAACERAQQKIAALIP